MATQRLEEIFHTALTPATADLIGRYAEMDESGFITKYQIINEEVIAALKKAAAALSDELLYGEQLSEHWERKSPCEGCESAPECTMTCRRKHAFDKEVYGGLLCGSLPCSYLAYEDENGEKNKVCFKVRFGAEDVFVANIKSDNVYYKITSELRKFNSIFAGAFVAVFTTVCE